MNMESRSWNNHKESNCTRKDKRWQFQQKIHQDNEAGGRCLVAAAGFVAPSLKQEHETEVCLEGKKKSIRRLHIGLWGCRKLQDTWSAASFALIGGWVSTQLCSGNFIFSFLCVGDKAILIIWSYRRITFFTNPSYISYNKKYVTPSAHFPASKIIIMWDQEEISSSHCQNQRNCATWLFYPFFWSC